MSSFHNFACDCILHESGLIKQAECYVIYYARSELPLGQNFLFWIARYRSPLHSFLSSSYHFINSYFYTTVDDDQLRTSSFLSELIEIRDGMAKFSNNFILSSLRCAI